MGRVALGVDPQGDPAHSTPADSVMASGPSTHAGPPYERATSWERGIDPAGVECSVACHISEGLPCGW
jgi:hypothetical protein